MRADEERCPWCERPREVLSDGSLADHLVSVPGHGSQWCEGSARTPEERAAKRARGEGPD